MSTDTGKTSAGDLWALLLLGVLAQAGGAGMAAIGWPRDRIAEGCDPTSIDPLTGRLEACDVDQVGDWATAVAGLVLSAAGSMMVLVALIAFGVRLGLSAIPATAPAAAPVAPGAAPVAPGAAPVAPARAVRHAEPAEPRQRRSDLQITVLVALGIVLAIALFAVTISVLTG